MYPVEEWEDRLVSLVTQLLGDKRIFAIINRLILRGIRYRLQSPAVLRFLCLVLEVADNAVQQTAKVASKRVKSPSSSAVTGDDDGFRHQDKENGSSDRMKGNLRSGGGRYRLHFARYHRTLIGQPQFATILLGKTTSTADKRCQPGNYGRRLVAEKDDTKYNLCCLLLRIYHARPRLCSPTILSMLVGGRY